MAVITKNTNNIVSSSSRVARGGLAAQLEKTGRLPPVQLIIKSLDTGRNTVLDRFLSYQFQSSVLIPVDSWNFNIALPDAPGSAYDVVKDGDIGILSANGIALSTGILDAVDIEVDKEFGEKVEVQGRDLMSQYEDNDAISGDDAPIWSNSSKISDVVRELNKNTRIPNDLILQGVSDVSGLFATEPGESKLAAFQRFLDPLNILAWIRGDGKMIVGKPNMTRRDGKLILSKSRRKSNVEGMKVHYSSTTIPNVVVPIWQGQEFVTNRVSAEQRLLNPKPGPTRLRKRGHVLSKTVVVSTPRGADAQALADVNLINQAGSGNILQAYAKRALARANVGEVTVQVECPGHYNEDGIPYQVDQVYKVEFDRGGIDEWMYVYQVGWSGSEEAGQKTVLNLCRLGTIVADIRSE